MYCEYSYKLSTKKYGKDRMQCVQKHHVYLQPQRQFHHQAQPSYLQRLLEEWRTHSLPDVQVLPRLKVKED